jgi:hypothetical protein
VHSGRNLEISAQIAPADVTVKALYKPENEPVACGVVLGLNRWAHGRSNADNQQLIVDRSHARMRKVCKRCVERMWLL